MFVRRLAQRIQRGSPDTLCRGVGRDEIGMGTFELREFPKQPVVLTVGNLRAVFHIVEIVVIPDAIFESGHAFLDGMHRVRCGGGVVIEKIVLHREDRSDLKDVTVTQGCGDGQITDWPGAL